MSSYGGYIERLARKVEARLQDIEAIYNFDLGDEFEIAMCDLLESLLPAKYGVCRGFVVAKNGEKAGDDLIIYDKMSSPTLRSSMTRQFPVKEQIPVDAVFAYIECKHSISDTDVLQKAVSQAEAVKNRCSPAEAAQTRTTWRTGRSITERSETGLVLTPRSRISLFAQSLLANTRQTFLCMKLKVSTPQIC